MLLMAQNKSMKKKSYRKSHYKLWRNEINLCVRLNDKAVSQHTKRRNQKKKQIVKIENKISEFSEVNEARQQHGFY